MKLAFAMVALILFAGSAFALPPQPPAGAYNTCGVPTLLKDGRTFVFSVWTKAMMPSYWEFPFSVNKHGRPDEKAIALVKALIARAGQPVHLIGYLVELPGGTRGYYPIAIDEAKPCR